MFIHFGPSESHKPLQYRRVFVPQEPISTSLRKIAPPWRMHVLEQVVHGRAGAQAHTLQIRAVCFREEVSRRPWAFEFQAVGMGLRVSGIHMVLKAVGRCEMARAVSYRERPGLETGLGAPHSERARRGARTSRRDQEGMAREVGKSQQPAWKPSRQSASGGGSARLSNAAGKTSGSKTENGRLGLATRRPLEMLTGAFSMKWWG